jgi:TRAP-type C4-dicarboxylate transport system permease large subunit
MAIPYGGKDSGLSLDRSTGFSGGALGFPLPAMGAVILLSILMESSIGRAFSALLIPMIGLSVIYLAIFLPTALARSRRERHPALPADTTSLVISCIVPPLFLLVLTLPIALGFLTPTEALGVTTVMAAIIAIVHLSLSAHARAAFGDGIIRGAAAAVMTIILLIAVSVIAQVSGLAGMPAAITGAVKSVLSNSYLIALIALTIGLGLGALAGPLTGISLATVITYPVVNEAGIDSLNFVMMMVVATEAARLGPQLHGKGFRKHVSDDGAVSLGSWPYYTAAIGVAAITPFIPPVS